MKIISGKWRGRPLVAPAGMTTRPTAGRVREALFSMLASRLGSFEGLRVLDLFAGSGALGLEALSRGAATCTFAETDRQAANALRSNLNKFRTSETCKILGSATALPRAQTAADLVFLDPPYGSGDGENALLSASHSGWIAPSAWISLETGRDESPMTEGFEVDTVRDIGRARITLLRALG